MPYALCAIIITAVLLLGQSAHAKEKWDKTDKALFGSYLILETVDYLQTRDILSNPKYYEKNHILKNTGKTGATVYFAACCVGTYLVADHLKPRHRKVFLTALNIFQIETVRHNYRLGIKLRF